jgi:hypothetical protein
LLFAEPGASKLTLHNDIGAIAGVFALVGFIPYWWAIWQGKTRPNRATWWIWSIVGIAIALSYRSAGADATIWVPITYVIGPLVTSLLGIKFGEGGWTKLDRICLVGVGIGSILWGVCRSPTLALGINIAIDFLGAIPTIHKSFRHPDSEDKLAWGLFTIANALNMLAIDRWRWQIAIYPIYMFLLCATISIFLWRGRPNGRKSI